MEKEDRRLGRVLVAENRSVRLFSKNTVPCESVRRCRGDVHCPMSVGGGRRLRLTLRAQTNGCGNTDRTKVARYFVH